MSIPREIAALLKEPKRRKLSKDERTSVYNKTSGRCAYCGVALANKWHVDHVKPLHGGGTHDFDNLLPACPRCNQWKSTHSVDGFRREISKQVERVRRYNSGFRLAEDFGLVHPTFINVVFYFEKGELNENPNQN